MLTTNEYQDRGRWREDLRKLEKEIWQIGVRSQREEAAGEGTA